MIIKEVRIGIRVPSELRDSFMRACDEKSMTASKLLRKWIEDFAYKYDPERAEDRREAAGDF